MHGSQYVTNQLRGSSTRLQSPTRDGCWLRCTNTATSHKNNELGQILSPITIFLNKLYSILMQLVSPLTALKIIFLYVQGCEKRMLKHIITDQSKKRTEILFFINLDRCLSVKLLLSSYRATGLEQLFKLHRWVAVEF